MLRLNDGIAHFSCVVSAQTFFGVSRAAEAAVARERALV